MTVMTLTSTDLRDRLASVLRQLREHPEPVMITERGRAEAVLLSIDQYESMIDLLEDREDELGVPATCISRIICGSNQSESKPFLKF